MKCGESDHYQGEKGREYFAYQNQHAVVGAKLERMKFENYISPTDRVLDFGCGGGWILSELNCAERIGVELNSEAHECCLANGLKVYHDLESVEERDIDVVISNHCLEHVPYPIEALKGIHRLLKTSGKMILVVPIDDWRVQEDHTGKDIDHHLHTWTPRLLANTLVEAGFSIKSIDVLTHAWFPRWFEKFGKMSQALFDLRCRYWSWKCKRRQLVAIVSKPAVINQSES